MALTIDIILLILFIAVIAASFKKGFVKIILDLLSLVTALALSLFISEPASEFIYSTFLKKGVLSTISNNLPEGVAAISPADQMAAALKGIPDSALKLSNTMGINLESLIDSSNTSGSGASVAEILEQNVAAPVVTLLCKIIVFIVLFIALYIVLKVLSRLINKIFKLPLLKTANKALGGLLGIVKAIIVVFLASSILIFASGFAKDQSSAFPQGVSQSHVISLFEDTGDKVFSSLKEVK